MIKLKGKSYFSEDEVKELFARLEELLDEDYHMDNITGLPARFRKMKSEFLGKRGK